ncbi:FAD-binding oxidoreductase [Pseudonocardia sp. H11422]|uniref:FAD-binding oxidoreductase n=1 Tax=Pseudonocardia sp. H11422 TaxID=2835866 RepID=UPI001BDD9BED|nr:FAD-binding oxidoreductase [Pseudonocardia sp. H11422]
MLTSVTARLRDQVRGRVVEPDDEDYEQARRVYNAVHDRRPAVVVRAVDAADVIATVDAAHESGLDLAVRGGGHSVAGFGTVDDGIVLDLGAMRGIRVDPIARTVSVQAGCTWGDVDHATHAFGLGTPSGIVSTTGVSGLTLGGGIGYLSRAHGLSCDNLIRADVVTADGRLVRADAKEQPDLYWALRGGGGNFGVVTELEFTLHPVDQVYGGPMLFELEHAEALLTTFRDWIADAPRAMGGFAAFQIAPPLPFIPQARHGEPFVILVTSFTGPAAHGAELLGAFRDIAEPVAEHVGVLSYPAMNSMFDALLPPGLRHYWKSSFARELTADAIAAHLVHGPRVPFAQSAMQLYPIDGAVHDMGPGDTAFAHRDAAFAPIIAGTWPDPAGDDAALAWVRDYFAALAPHSTAGGYVNFMPADDRHRVPDNYGSNHGRLVEVKRQYDPDNLFHLNQNIAP